jgi:hypothetical protein
LRFCKERNKSATLRLFDVLVTQHANWTARRIRRALFGQSLADFSVSDWSSIKLYKSVSECQPVNRSKKTFPSMAQEFSQAGINTAPNHADKEKFPSLVPGMPSYEYQDTDMVIGCRECKRQRVPFNNCCPLPDFFAIV